MRSRPARAPAPPGRREPEAAPREQAKQRTEGQELAHAPDGGRHSAPAACPLSPYSAGAPRRTRRAGGAPRSALANLRVGMKHARCFPAAARKRPAQPQERLERLTHRGRVLHRRNRPRDGAARRPKLAKRLGPSRGGRGRGPDVLRTARLRRARRNGSGAARRRDTRSQPGQRRRSEDDHAAS